jgi:uncharacterized membrane protein YcaP (DUF421 family)
MDASIIGVRVFFTFAVLLVLLRLSGKRIVAESTVFDFILAIIVGDLVDDVFFGEQPVSMFIAGLGTLIVLEVVMRLFSRAYPRFANLLEGEPVLIVKDGVPIHANLKKTLLAYKELRAMLRLDGFLAHCWKEIRVAFLEQNGHASLFLKDEYKKAQKRDLEK